MDRPSSPPRGDILSAPMGSFRAALQAEEQKSIPLRARNMPGHCTQRFVYALLITEAFFQHLHGYALLLELAGEPGAWCGQAGIAGIKPPLSCRPGQLLYK